MKHCYSCATKKQPKDFYKNKNKKDGLNPQCKQCHNDRVNARKLKHRKFLWEYKLSKGCAHCGYDELPYVLEFDHIDLSSKDDARRGSWAIDAGWSMERIKNEINKCQILCANCHAIKTYKERQT
jgi:hypothetical protein